MSSSTAWARTPTAKSSYTFQPTFSKIGAVYERLSSSADEPVPATQGIKDASRNAYYVSLVKGLGSNTHEIAAAFALADKISTTPSIPSPNDKTGAMYYTVAYRFNWTKQLMLYVAYTRIQNDDFANYDFAANGSLGQANIQLGAKPEAYNAGIRFLF